MTHILMIEDEHNILEEVLEWFEFENYQASGASNGREGVEKALALHPALILCDVTMPVMNGYEVLAEIRSQPQTAGIPFIFLTARADESFVQQGMSLGANAYVTKPFTMDELFSKMRDCLS